MSEPKNIEKMLDALLDQMDELFKQGKFAEADRILDEIYVQRESTDMLLCYLTATLPAKSKLKSREAFYKKVQTILIERGEVDPTLLQGLG